MKPYAAAWCRRELGNDITINLARNGHPVTHMLHALLQRKETRLDPFININYPQQLRIFISIDMWKRHGGYFTSTDIRAFNAYVEDAAKTEFIREMDRCWKLYPSFDGNIPHVRSMIGISEDEWPTPSLQKIYYRHRKKNNGKVLANDEIIYRRGRFRYDLKGF